MASMPELGSKISLISKSDIRYEGQLYTVDPNECTIALANGKFCVYYFFLFVLFRSSAKDFVFFFFKTSLFASYTKSLQFH